MQYIGFRLNENEYSIPILNVREIIQTPVITRIPQTPLYIEGVTNIRGIVIPIINLKKLMDVNGCDGKGGNVIIVSSGKITFGILVDSISGVIAIDKSLVEPSERFLKDHIDQVEGVAKFSGRLVILLDARKLLPLEDISLLEDPGVDILEKDDQTVEVVKKIQTMGGEIKVKELHDAKAFFEKKGIPHNDPRYVIFDDIITFIDALSRQDYNEADSVIQDIIKKGQSDLFAEIGKITRKLHDSLRGFKEAIDPFKEMATVDMPNAIDRLQFVIDKTEEAANKTLGIVEKHILKMDELSSHVRNLREPEDSANYLKDFKNKLEDDLTEIITTQSFQDITGQVLKKVIKLVGDIEEELVRLIAHFGVKIEQGFKAEAAVVSEKVSQTDVDDLLKEFGF